MAEREQDATSGSGVSVGGNRAGASPTSQAPADGERPDATVEVVYALPDVQTIVELPHHDGMTAADAVAASGLAERYTEIAARPLVLGINGVEAGPTTVLEPDDRVEICRPLRRDPRELRAALASMGRTMGRGVRES